MVSCIRKLGRATDRMAGSRVSCRGNGDGRLSWRRFLLVALHLVGSRVVELYRGRASWFLRRQDRRIWDLVPLSCCRGIRKELGQVLECLSDVPAVWAKGGRWLVLWTGNLAMTVWSLWPLVPWPPVDGP